jgi:hypothetical protein
MLTQEEARARASEFIRDGKMIEAGWIVGLLKDAPEGTTKAQLDVMRMSFFCGAQHMLTLMLTAQNAGVDDGVIRQLVSDINEELAAWVAAAKARQASKPH